MKTVIEVIDEILGSNAYIKILDCLIDGREFDYSIKDIGKAANITRQYTYKVINALLGHGVVKKTRLLSGIQLYQINEDNTIIRGLIEFKKKEL